MCLLTPDHSCPGSTIFLFEGPQSDPKSPLPPSSRIYRYLHCGDFRASPAHLAHPVLRGKKLDICYLDTTYLDPKYCFPAQELVINACVDLVRAKVVDGDDEGITAIGGAGMEGERGQMKGWLTKGKKEEVEEAGIDAAGMKGKAKEVQKADRWLVVVGTYSVGKERIVKSTSFPPLSTYTANSRCRRYRRIAQNEDLRQSDKDETPPRARRSPPQLTPHARPPPRPSPRRLPQLNNQRTPRSLPSSISTSPQRLYETYRTPTDGMDVQTGEGCEWEYDCECVESGEFEDSESGGNDSAEGFETWLFGFWSALF